MVMKNGIEQAFENASQMMKDSGFGINEKVKVLVDKKLPFMGYSTSQGWKQHLIVVSGMALNSGMVEGLLLHEMSHIYRTIANHPSHNGRIIADVEESLVRKKGLSREYERKGLFDAVNHIQDLYADDITFKVVKENESKLFPLNQMGGFLQSWVKDKPIVSKNGERDKWANASMMLDNSFALSSMERHGILDTGNKAAELNQRFLANINPEASEKFKYFKNLMTNLKEEVSDAEYRNLLNDYLENFLEVIKEIHQS